MHDRFCPPRTSGMSTRQHFQVLTYYTEQVKPGVSSNYPKNPPPFQTKITLAQTRSGFGYSLSGNLDRFRLPNNLNRLSAQRPTTLLHCIDLPFQVISCRLDDLSWLTFAPASTSYPLIVFSTEGNHCLLDTMMDMSSVYVVAPLLFHK